MTLMFKHLLFIILFFTSLHAENYSYTDLLKESQAEQVKALQEANAFFGWSETTQFQSLEGGLTRAKVYSFEFEEKKYAVRFLALTSCYSKEMRQNEIQAMKIGNQLGIAPECIFSDQDAILMVMPFIQGHSLHHPNDHQLSQLGSMIRNLHNYSDSYPTRFSLKDRIRLHYQRALKIGIAYPTGFDLEVQNVLNEPTSRPLVPSHGDLNLSNILIDDFSGDITIIDWTTATWEDPFFDLSFFCLLSNLSPLQEEVFLEAYFGRKPLEKEREILKKEKAKICLLTATIWLRYSETPDETVFPLESRIAALDAELYSPTLKSIQEYLREGIVVDLKTAPKSEVKSYALSFYKAYLETQSVGESTYNPTLLNEITGMYKRDQETRFEVLNSGNLASEEGKMRVENMDREHLPLLKTIVEQFGWPGFRTVGEEGAEKMWLLIQHCDQDIEFQKTCLQLLIDSVAKGDALKRHVAIANSCFITHNSLHRL
jgi:serine/threonine protein kinase